MFDKWIILTLTTTAICVLATGVTAIRNVRSGENAVLRCQVSSMGVYRWTRNGADITAQTVGIVSDSISKNTLRISSMSQSLVGMYECYLNDNNEPQNTIQVQIVGIAKYRECPDSSSGPCSINYNYTIGQTISLDATIVFEDSGVPCCDENLTEPVWTVKPTPGTFTDSTEVMNNETKSIDVLGITISVRTSANLTNNTANVTINSANTTFQILHEIHTNVGQDGQQEMIIFNFNYTGGSLSSTSSASSTVTSTTSMAITTSIIPTESPTPSPTGSDATPSTNIIQSSSSLSENTVSPTITDQPVTSREDDNNSNGVIIGVVISVIIVLMVIIIAFIIVMVVYKQRKNKQDSADISTSTSGHQTNGRPKKLPLASTSTSTPLLQAPSIMTSTATPQQPYGGGPPLPYPGQSSMQNGDDNQGHPAVQLGNNGACYQNNADEADLDTTDDPSADV